MRDRILITGASGLLGNALLRHFAEFSETIPLSHSCAEKGMLQVELLKKDSLASLRNLDWNIMINCAAYRDPDFCEAHPEQAFQLNAEIPGMLAGLASEREALMVQVSSDYVFGAAMPPYPEDHHPCPVNRYGESKAEGEDRVRDACDNHIILRIPVLYGDPPPHRTSAFLAGALDAVLSDEIREMDDVIIRRPTCITDVAATLDFLIKESFIGTIHVSAEEMTTNLGWASQIASSIGIDPSSAVTRMKTPLRRKAVRPENSSLDISLLKSIGGPVPRPFSEVLPEIKIIKDYKC